MNGDSMKDPHSPMQVTRAADYAVRVLVQLATAPGGDRMSLPELAIAASAPESFLSKVLQELVRAGLITSRRGQAGGFAISSRGFMATMREVVEIVDGPMRLNVCLGPGRSCNRKSWCPAHPVWARAQQAMLDILESSTVAGLASEAIAARHAESCTACLQSNHVH